MGARAQLVSQAVEAALTGRLTNPFAQPVRVVERMPFGIAALDAAVQGGVPLGAITELVGPASSGRTSAALSLVRRFGVAGNVCAWVDVADALDPESAAAGGVDLKRLLWVRCGGAKADAVERIQPATVQGFAGTRAASPGCGPHPRTEGRDMPQAIQSMLGAHGGLLEHQMRRERKMLGTPGLANRALSARAPDRQEQPPTDRLPSRRGEQLVAGPRCAEPQPRRRAPEVRPQAVQAAPAKALRREEGKPWTALDQALRATDLLLLKGGFAAIVLDLGSTPAEFAWRIPVATWFRYRAACERSRASLLLLTQHPCARSSAGLVVRMQAAEIEAESTVMTGARFQAEAERSRFAEPPARVVSIRKPPRPERAAAWQSEAAWA